jgi:hypothetical protein
MRKFLDYPIVINYSLHTQLRANSEMLRLHQTRQYEKEKQLVIKSYTTSDSTIENNLWKQEVERYESTVYQCLQTIVGNPVGKQVLGLVNKQTTVWIVPKSDTDLKACNCAQTGPLNYEIPSDGSYARGVGSGDTVITFRPELGDDTLFHELVHAYRYSYNKFKPIKFNVSTERLRATQSIEEFFAHQMENIYLSCRNRPLHLDYKWDWVALKKEIYDFLASNTEMLMAIKSLLRHEYLAMLAAHSFTIPYNPFRDYKELEAECLKDSDMKTLPEL